MALKYCDSDRHLPTNINKGINAWDYQQVVKSYNLQRVHPVVL